MKTRILVVADDATLRAMLARGLLQAGYAVELAESARRAREVIAQESVALAILAPRGVTAVTELARELKDKVGRLVLVAEGDQSLETSLDTLVSPDSRIRRPFTEPELLAKIKSELSTSGPVVTKRDEAIAQARDTSGDGPSVLTFEGYTLYSEARSCVHASGRELTLTRAEFSLLLAFARQPGRVLSRDELSHVVAGRGAEPDDRSVDVLISRLRRKIEPDARAPRIIVTMPGEGYKFTARSEPVERAGQTIVAPAPASGIVQAIGIAPGEGGAEQTSRSRGVWIGASAVAVLLVAIGGWTAWQTRTVSRELAQVASSVSSPPPPTSTATSTSEQERRAAAYKRMVAAMQDDHYNWRTIERLAIESGVEEAEAHEILAEHPDQVVLGKSHEGKLLARLADR
jgi:DNA-binding response OmpR family regulator